MNEEDKIFTKMMIRIMHEMKEEDKNKKREAMLWKASHTVREWYIKKLKERYKNEKIANVQN